MANEIPDIVIGRLPIYLRELIRFSEESHKQTTSSQELGRRLGISSAQIRKDFSHFGGFGKQGTGYSVKLLIERLSAILHLTQNWEMALIGAGFLGHALAHYDGFQHRGFHIAAIFDNDPQQIGQTMGGITVQDISELETAVQEQGIKIAILSVPISVAQEITNRLVKAGIISILSYVPIHLQVPNHVRISYSDPVIQLQQMAYYLLPQSK